MRREEIEPALRAALEASLAFQAGLDEARVGAAVGPPPLLPLP